MAISYINCAPMRPKLLSWEVENLTILVDTDQGPVLIDTGLGLHDYEAPTRRVRLFHYLFGIPYAPQQTAIRQLETMGISPTNVKHVIQTHLHFDHAGGLPDFPWAQVHLHQKEYEAMLKPKTLLEWSAYDKADFSHQPHYEDDPRVERCFRWLLSMRQDDGGWSIPMITNKFDRETQYKLSSEFLPPVEPDRTKPFSHNWTGLVLRAFAAHPNYRYSIEARHAANLLKSRFFEPDSYTSYQDPKYWIRFEYPFWWNNLVSAMDTLTKMGYSSKEPQAHRAIEWFIEHQQSNGLWKLNYSSDSLEKTSIQVQERKIWVSLAICRILKHLPD